MYNLLLPDLSFTVSGWGCDFDDYDSGVSCNCECSDELVDPDCSDTALPITGCDTGQVCTLGQCVSTHDFIKAFDDYLAPVYSNDDSGGSSPVGVIVGAIVAIVGGAAIAAGVVVLYVHCMCAT